MNQAWGPQMWALIDSQMTLKECSVYCYAPEEDPYDGEEGAIWSLNYFFFNKALKRVAYFYVRGIPVMSRSPRIGYAKRGAAALSTDIGANKRARFWLGDRADNLDASDADEDLDDDPWNLDDDADVDNIGFDADEYDDEADDESEQDYRESIRGVSEDIVAGMEI